MSGGNEINKKHVKYFPVNCSLGRSKMNVYSRKDKKIKAFSRQPGTLKHRPVLKDRYEETRVNFTDVPVV